MASQAKLQLDIGLKIIENMEMVRDLSCFRSTFSSGSGKPTASIPIDKLDVGMGAEDCFSEAATIISDCFTNREEM